RQGSHLFLGPGCKGCLGSELENRRRGWLLAMLLNVVGDEAVLLDINMAGTSRELRHQRLRHGTDRPGGVTITTHLPDFPFDSECAGHVIGKHCLVQS